jgi:hypothetical protein
VVNVDNHHVFAAVADQRRQFASLINDLDDAQLATPSLCLGWDSPDQDRRFCVIGFLPDESRSHSRQLGRKRR